MNKENEVKALFVLCQDLKAQVKNLTEKVEALSEVQTTSNCNCSKEIYEIQVEITDLVDFQIEESAKADKELDLVDKAMDRLFSRTNDLRNNQMTLESKVKMLSAPQAHSISVNRTAQPQFTKSNQSQRTRPDQFRRQVRICYNCKKPGHFAASCTKPNPRQPLSAGYHPKTKLSVQFQTQEPETNSVQNVSDPEVNATFGTVKVPVQANGFYTPYVYPNGSSNPMLKNYSWAELNKPATPYGS